MDQNPTKIGPEMFTLCIQVTSLTRVGYTIVKPDTCYSSGSCETLEQVFARMREAMEEYSRNSVFRR